MQIVYSYTFGYFPIYDDEYEGVHYDDDDDDDQTLHDIREFVDLQTSSYGQLARL